MSQIPLWWYRNSSKVFQHMHCALGKYGLVREFFKSCSSSTLSGLWLSPLYSCHSLFFCWDMFALSGFDAPVKIFKKVIKGKQIPWKIFELTTNRPTTVSVKSCPAAISSYLARFWPNAVGLMQFIHHFSWSIQSWLMVWNCLKSWRSKMQPGNQLTTCWASLQIRSVFVHILTFQIIGKNLLQNHHFAKWKFFHIMHEKLWKFASFCAEVKITTYSLDLCHHISLWTMHPFFGQQTSGHGLI